MRRVEGCPTDAPGDETEEASEPARSRPDESIESFKNDPLIQEALEIFKGEIKSVST